jgi:hypothetical protein
MKKYSPYSLLGLFLVSLMTFFSFVSCDEAPEKGVYFDCIFSSDTLVAYGGVAKIKINVKGSKCYVKDIKSDMPFYIDGVEVKAGSSFNGSVLEMATEPVSLENGGDLHFHISFSQSQDAEREVVYDCNFVFGAKSHNVKPVSISLPDSTFINLNSDNRIEAAVLPADENFTLKWRLDYPKEYHNAFIDPIVNASKISSTDRQSIINLNTSFFLQNIKARLKVMSAVDTTICAYTDVFVRYDATLNIDGNFSSSNKDDYNYLKNMYALFTVKMVSGRNFNFWMNFHGTIVYLDDKGIENTLDKSLIEGNGNLRNTFTSNVEYKLYDVELVYDACYLAPKSRLRSLKFTVSDLQYDSKHINLVIKENYKLNYWWKLYDK